MNLIAKKASKGFTLIELLVVVAIIGILASIVLVSLNSARAKGRDASAKGSISSVRAAAEIFYDSHAGTYDDGIDEVCTDAAIGVLLDAAEAETGNAPVCSAEPLSYAVAAVLNNNNTFCVDSSGFAGDFFSDGSAVTGIGTNSDGDQACIGS